MIKKISILFLLNLFFMSFNCQNTGNPKAICKDCGSFDLNKIKFTENILDLTSQTEVSKSSVKNSTSKPNDKTQNSKSNDLLKYSFLNSKNLNLGNKPFNYNNEFNFNQLNILADFNNEILALNATIFYDGKMDDINKFLDNLKKENKSAKMITGKMYGDLTVYQWFSDDKIVQLVKDNQEGTEEQTNNGKTITKKSTYLKLNIYGSSFAKNSIKNIVETDSDFVLYDARHFIKK